jgi:hypothetical protein
MPFRTFGFGIIPPAAFLEAPFLELGANVLQL